MTDNEIIEEAIRLVREGVSVTLPVNGNSMLPFVIGGKESVILQKPELPKVGDVVLAWADGYRYVVHRIVRIDGERVTLMGDGNLVGTEHCLLNDIKARVTHVVDAKERTHYLYKGWRKRAAKIWFRLRPMRRYSLAINRRIEGLKN
jgi:hypothetical protein